MRFAKPRVPALGGHHASTMLLGLVVLTGLSAIAALLLFSISTVNGLSRQHLHDRLEVAIDVERSRLQDLLVEYRDRAIDARLTSRHALELAMVIDDSDNIASPSGRGQNGTVADPAALIDALQPLLRVSRRQPGRAGAANGFVVYRDEPYLVALDAYTGESANGGAPNHALLLLGRRLDEAYISQIRQTYRLEGLRLADMQQPQHSRLLLRDAHNHVVLVLGWPEAEPAARSFQVIAAPLLVLVLLMLILSAWILRRDHRRRGQVEQHLDKLARIDPLTGTLNRRALYQMVTREIGRVHRDHSDLTMLVLDIDHLKRINESYGHEAGDLVLQEFSRVIRDNLREADIFARIGGEEFALALPATSEQQAFELAERLRRDVANLKIFHELKRIRITVSIGISQYQPGDSHESLVARADRALHHCKDNGRDQSHILEDQASGQGLPSA